MKIMKRRPLISSPLGAQQLACGNRVPVENPTTVRIQRERPMLYSGPMVRAILDGLKTQTRRFALKTINTPVEVWRTDGHGTWYGVNNVAASGGLGEPATPFIECPYGEPGDRLWVKETHAFYSLQYHELGKWHPTDRDVCCHYREGCPMELSDCIEKWRPSIFMPRWASRLTLEITDIRIERLNAISEDDAIAEGIDVFEDGAGFTVPLKNGKLGPWHRNPADAYRSLWEVINGAGSWAANPYVWVIQFKRVT